MPVFILKDNKLIIAEETTIDSEVDLESWFERNPLALIKDETVLWIGRQTRAQDEEGTLVPDLLGVDSDGNLVIVEFKRGRTPRDVVAQLLEYAAWANELPEEDIHGMTDTYLGEPDEFKGKTFLKAFHEVFDIPETDNLPPLNRKLRLFVIAGDIHPRVARVCRFLRTTYKMDISCIAVSKFQTESNDEIISTETKVGDEEIVTPKSPQRTSETAPSSSDKSETAPSSGDKNVRQVVLEAVQEFIGDDAQKVFAPKDIKAVVLEKDPDFNENTVGAQIHAGCPNSPSYQYHPGDHKLYWKIGTGKFRLYNAETDNVDGDGIDKSETPDAA